MSEKELDEFFEKVGTENDQEINYRGPIKNLSILVNHVARGLVKPNDMFYLKTLKYILIAKKARDSKVGMDFTIFTERVKIQNLLTIRKGANAWRSNFESE